MKSFKVRILLLLLAGLFLLSSCHGSRGLTSFEVPQDFDVSKTQEITFWAKNDTNKTQTDIYKKAIADFETLYPNIKVNLRLYTDYGKIYNDVITNLATGTTPNVCITYPDHIATYLTGENSVVPLDDLFTDGKYGLGGSEIKFSSPAQAEIVPRFLEECRFGGSYYAVPFMRSTEACYVNKTFVEKLGYTLPETLTWDFVWEVSRAAAVKDDDGTFLVNGQNVMIPFIYKSTDNMMITQLRQKNAGFSTDNGEILLFNDTTAQLLYTVADYTQNGAFSTFKISGYPANFLNSGQCIFAIDSTAGATWMGSDAPLSDISADKLVSFETAVMAVPQFDINDPKMISQGPSVCIFNKDDPREVLASWLFVQYLLSDEVQIAYSQTEGYIPVTSRAQDSEVYRDYLSRAGEDNSLYYDVKIKAVKLFLENIENTFTTPVFNGSASLRDAAGQLVENVTKSVKRKEAIDSDYIEKLYGDVSALYRLSRDSVQGDPRAGTETGFATLPKTAKVFLITMLTIWIFIGLYVLMALMRKFIVKRK